MAFHEVPLQYIHMNKDFEKIKNELSLGAINILRHTDPIKLALRARRVNPALDPGGSGKELVGKGY